MARAEPAPSGASKNALPTRFATTLPLGFSDLADAVATPRSESRSPARTVSMRRRCTGADLTARLGNRRRCRKYAAGMEQQTAVAEPGAASSAGRLTGPNLRAAGWAFWAARSTER